MQESPETPIRELIAPFARPATARAWGQLLSTGVLFLASWALMAYGVRHDWTFLVILLLAVPTAGLIVRLFIFQHDCGHGSFFASPRLILPNSRPSTMNNPRDAVRSAHCTRDIEARRRQGP